MYMCLKNLLLLMIAQFKSNMCQNVIFSFVMMECSSQPDVSQCCQQITETRKGGSEGGGNVCACVCACEREREFGWVLCFMFPT